MNSDCFRDVGICVHNTLKQDRLDTTFANLLTTVSKDLMKSTDVIKPVLRKFLNESIKVGMIVQIFGTYFLAEKLKNEDSSSDEDMQRKVYEPETESVMNDADSITTTDTETVKIESESLEAESSPAKNDIVSDEIETEYK